MMMNMMTEALSLLQLEEDTDGEKHPAKCGVRGSAHPDHLIPTTEIGARGGERCTRIQRKADITGSSL